MKIRNIMILCLAACLLLAGCTTGGTGTVINQTPDNVEQAPTKNDPVTEPTTAPTTEPTTAPTTEPQPQKRELTLEEVNDYFVFTTSTSDVEVTSGSGGKRGKGKLTVTVNCKKHAEFEGVVLTVTMTTTSSGWTDNPNYELQVAYDGKCEQEYNIYSLVTSYVSSSPKYKIEVTAVSGYVVE